MSAYAVFLSALLSPLSPRTEQATVNRSRFLLAYVEKPQPGVTWPGWHLPLTPWEQKPNWWKLYVRQADGQFAEVQIPRADRRCV